jgi:hypothetical protein
MIAEYTVPWLTVENPKARELALKWMKSEKELMGAAGWCTYSGIVATTPDTALDLTEIEKLLGTAVKTSRPLQTAFASAMNGFVIAVGSYVKPLSKQAKAAAKQIETISVDVGDTDCKIPLATAYIEKIESAGRLGQKRSTVRR